MPSEATPLRLSWSLAAREDYNYWQGQDKKTLRRINAVIRDTLRHPFDGIGKPEPLKENLSGFWSRRIDDAHRLVYCVDGESLVVIACRYHYQ
ncbi:MAG: Txe/YoeB family addiction module toxin [Betaproteobacteria bacterium]|nr:Txe/YoeB family addiction module toxin [Betaproteobacteria bacterium]